MCSATCATARTCTQSSAMRCGLNPRGISTAVHGCTVPYVDVLNHLCLGHSHSIAHAGFVFRRSRCYRGTSTSASPSKVTRVRVPRFVPLSCSDDLISHRMIREGTGTTVYFTSIRRACGDLFRTCACLPTCSSHPPILHMLPLTRYKQCVSR